MSVRKAMEFESSPRSASTSTSTTASVSFNLPPRKPSIHRQPYQHPFQVPKILKKVLTYVNVEDLKASRLVAHSWHAEATHQLTSRIQPILLHDKVEWKRFLKLLSKSCSSPKMSKLGHIHPFHSFVFLSTYPDDPSATPYKTAILDYMHAKYRLPRKTLWETRFYSTYGSQITQLQLTQFNLYTEKALRELREMLSTSCPNLYCLTLQFQKEAGSSSSTGGSTSSTSTPTPTPSPSPSPHMVPGNDNVFFPPNQSSQRKTLYSLRYFKLTTDNKIYLNPHALEEFMALMPSLEEFCYRHTGAKKQWTLVRRVDIIDVLCNVINAGHYSRLEKLDLDSNGTVMSGEDFKKFCGLRRPLKLRAFAAQVFIKSEPDWESVCTFLCKLGPYLESLDLQVRTHFPQLLSGQELPRCFPRVGRAKLLLDSNLKTFLRRMPLLKWFTGVYDNELVPLAETLSLEGQTPSSYGRWGVNSEGNESAGSSTSSPFTEPPQHFFHGLYEKKESEEMDKVDETRKEITCTNEENEENFDNVTIIEKRCDFEDYNEGPSCPSATHLIIQGNDEFGLDIEWKARVFFNIQSFETDIYFDEDLRLIWLHLQGIRRLVLHLKTKVPEQAFTGMGVPSLPPSGWKGANADEDLHDAQHLSRLEEYPNIGMMKRLEVLEIYTGSRQDAYGSQFSASLIIYGAALLPHLRRLVLPPAIPPKCLEDSLRYLAKLKDLTYLSVCDDTFNSVLPFHMLKLDLPNLEIVVRYYHPEIKRMVGHIWKLERFIFPDFLPEHGRKCMDKRHSAPS